MGNNVHRQSENLEEDLEVLADATSDVVSLNTKLRQAKTALSTVKIFVDLIKCCGGPIKPAGSIAAPILKLFKTGVDRAYGKLNPFVSSKLVGGWKLQGKLNTARYYNNKARTTVEK